MEEENESKESRVVKYVGAAASFLARTLPEFTGGLDAYLADKMAVRRWRNRVCALERAEEFIKNNPNATRVPAPDFILRALEDVGSVEDSVLRDMWAGLFASACVTETAEHPAFLDTLRQMGPSEARAFYRICLAYGEQLPGGEPPEAMSDTVSRGTLAVLGHLGLIDLSIWFHPVDSDPDYPISWGRFLGGTRGERGARGFKIYGSMLARAINGFVAREE